MLNGNLASYNWMSVTEYTIIIILAVNIILNEYYDGVPF